jgi:hypothetical protein
MDFILRPDDRALFKRCRRAWDLGARARRNLEPTDQPARLDIERAVHDALAVYYFPGMWDWAPGIVLPLVRQAFEKSVARQVRGMSPERRQEVTGTVERGRQALESYFDWAPVVDRFAPVRVDTDLDVQLPDPREAGRDLATPDGWSVRYQDRLDLLVIDEDDAYWVLDHRVVDGDWTHSDAMLLDEQCLAWCWAWELFYPGMVIAGTIYNELRLDAPVPPASGQTPAARSPVSQHRRTYVPPTRTSRADGGERMLQQGTDCFRRTQIGRTPAELAAFGSRLGLEALEMTDPELALYPNPSARHCLACAYRRPCIAMNEDLDLAAAELAHSYRTRPPEQVEEGRLGGSTWSMGRGAMPPKFGSARSDPPPR